MSKDLFIGTNGNDTFHGGADSDTVVLAGNAEGYRIDVLADGRVQVIDIDSSNGNTGADTFTGIETLRFADKSYKLGWEHTSGLQGNVLVNAYDNYYTWVGASALTSGGYVVTWTEKLETGTGSSLGDVYAQLYDTAGNKIGAATRVSTYQDATTESWMKKSVVTSLPDGGYVVAWESSGQDGGGDEGVAGIGIYAQRFDSAGNRVGSEMRVNTTVGGGQYLPSITSCSNGDYVIAWETWGQDSFASTHLYTQRFDDSGKKIGGETRVTTHMPGDGYYYHDIAALEDGGYVVTWESDTYNGPEFGRWNIHAQRFDSAGQKVGGETMVNSFIPFEQGSPAVAAMADGGYLIVWEDQAKDGSNYGIYGQRFNSSGQKVGDQTRINTTTINNQDSPDVTLLADGGYVVVWEGYSQISSEAEIYAQRYDRGGSKLGAEVLISTGVDDDKYNSSPSVNALADGGYVIIWSSNTNADGEIRSQRFDAEGRAFGQGVITIRGTAGSDILKTGIDKQILLGFEGNDLLSGGSDFDRLRGDVGDDILSGGNGNDRLTGGSGNDVFRFNVALSASSNVDTITDYVAANDTIQIDNAIYKKLAAIGTLSTANFRASTTGNAADSNDYILYEIDTGKVLYDADGSGAGVKVLFAVIGTTTHPALAASDFVVI